MKKWNEPKLRELNYSNTEEAQDRAIYLPDSYYKYPCDECNMRFLDKYFLGLHKESCHKVPVS